MPWNVFRRGLAAHQDHRFLVAGAREAHGIVGGEDDLPDGGAWRRRQPGRQHFDLTVALFIEVRD